MYELECWPFEKTIIGTTTAASDAAVASFFENFLERENQGTLWRVIEGRQDADIPARREFGSGTGKVNDE